MTIVVGVGVACQWRATLAGAVAGSWWAGPVVITATLLVTLRRAGRRPDRPHPEPTEERTPASMDIVELIMADHHEQRRMFALLDEVGNDPDLLEPVWKRLSILLEVHARAEERLFYPRLLAVGEGAGGADDAEDETKDAIRDHDDIRDGIRRASRHPAGSGEWWRAVADTRAANSDHMGEEEREALADFRRHASLQARHELAVQFAVYEAAHAGGVPLEDQDPDRYVRRYAG